MGRRQFQDVFPDVLAVSAVVDPASVATGAQGTGTVTVTGAAVGDKVEILPGVSAALATITGYVSAANTVTWLLVNLSGGAIDLASSTWKVLVYKVRLP